MAAQSRRAVVRRAAPAWSAAAGRAGRALPCSTMAATSNWDASSLSSALPSSPVSSPKKSRPPRLLQVALAPPAASAAAAWPAPPPAPPPPPPQHHPPVLPQWAAPPARMRLTLRLFLPTKCPYCTPTLFHNPHKKSRPPSFCFAPSESQWRESCTAGWSTGKSLFFNF